MQFIKVGERLINLGTISYIQRKGDTVYFAHNAMAENEHLDYGLSGNEAIAAYEFLRDTFAVTIPATDTAPAPQDSKRFRNAVAAIHAEHGVPDFVAFNDDSTPDSGAHTQMTLEQETIDILTAQVSKLTAELESATREVDTMQDSIDDLNHMLDLARAERNSAKAQLAECNHAHELARTQRDAATELYSGKHSRLEDVKRELEVSRDAMNKRRLALRDAIEDVLERHLGMIQRYDTEQINLETIIKSATYALEKALEND